MSIICYVFRLLFLTLFCCEHFLCVRCFVYAEYGWGSHAACMVLPLGSLKLESQHFHTPESQACLQFTSAAYGQVVAEPRPERREHAYTCVGTEFQRKKGPRR